MTLPEEYVRYFTGDGPKEGSLTVDPGRFQLWPPGEIEHWNRAYQVAEFAPGFLGFGSSGGGELLAFDLEERVVMSPFIGMSREDALPIANSWSEFVERIKR
jgi:hypothetical protein